MNAISFDRGRRTPAGARPRVQGSELLDRCARFHEHHDAWVEAPDAEASALAYGRLASDLEVIVATPATDWPAIVAKREVLSVLQGSAHPSDGMLGALTRSLATDAVSLREHGLLIAFGSGGTFLAALRRALFDRARSQR